MSLEAMIWAWQQELAPTTKLVLLAIADYSNPQKECWPSHQAIAGKTGLTRRSVLAHVQELIEAGFIKAINKKGRVSTYMLQYEDVRVKSIHRPASEKGSHVQEIHTGCERDSHPPVKEIHTEPVKEPVIESSISIDREKPEWLLLLETEIPKVHNVKWKAEWSESILAWIDKRPVFSDDTAMRVARDLISYKKSKKQYALTFYNWYDKQVQWDAENTERYKRQQPSNNAVLTPEQRAEKYRRAAEEYADLAVVDYDEESDT